MVHGVLHDVKTLRKLVWQIDMQKDGAEEAADYISQVRWFLFELFHRFWILEDFQTEEDS